MSESKAKPASPIPPATTIQCCNSLTDTQCPALQVTSRMLRSPSHESVTTDLSLFSVSSIASELRGVNRLVTFKSYTDIHLSGRGPSPKPDSRQVQSNREMFVVKNMDHEILYKTILLSTMNKKLSSRFNTCNTSRDILEKCTLCPHFANYKGYTNTEIYKPRGKLDRDTKIIRSKK
ncbi:uncharacterized protein LOC117238463 isoform X1 [Bombus vosnesenskii]|uniref:Uncharacterized protein LOC117238463 isoform X1 n=2 Tax=Pyrobombus TaxID=144703 RepID=A0A6J3L475_9HYME|nr:uncharacterized protein LOC112213546 isoform X2 [Bombus impatiens]XP_033178878.1 uncharacterized protein LOC112213546 isoform X2 [Bombus impatiens]XP_033359256.1 uncharacterized protein LOC117238463 isoform X1 [Bombus vosnesenskii]